MGAKSNPSISVIDRLRSSLTHKGMSITQLAEKLGISRQAVYSWMKSGNVSQKYVDPLCQLLDIKAEWLLFGTPNEPSGSNSCYLHCELKNTLIELLLTKHDLIAEHNILSQDITWHGTLATGLQAGVLPTNIEGLREWIDPDYYHMFHHALLRYHLYKDRQKVVFPLQQHIAPKGRWVELEFESQCNNEIIIYSLKAFKA